MRTAFDHVSTPEAFCAALKRAREARCISLREISESTKIAVNHLTALERADLRHWPKGIYRRAYFRDYAKAVGLPDDTIGRFLHFFGEEEDGPRVLGAKGPEVRGAGNSGAAGPGAEGADGAERSDLRLVLDAAPAPRGWRSGIVAAIDGAIALLLAFKMHLGAPRTLPVPAGTRSAGLGAAAPRTSAPSDLRTFDPDPEWTTDARRLPNARPQMRVRMRVVR
jgi:hypothetical protein